ncbi:MAG: hypothetical protein ABIZ52_06325 [Candidatus Limnocylindrales bacterium]
MTTDAALAPGIDPAIEGTDPDAEPDADGRMFCYRHPDRETWLRCGRCDQPICSKCAVQGPVGSRCRQCGLVKNDPLTSFTPRQLLLGLGTAAIGGVVVGYASSYVGFFSILLGYFAGRIVADTVVRAVGYKRGPVMLAIVFGGLFLGTALGYALQILPLLSTVPDQADALLPFLLQSIVSGVLISGGAACFGAYQRLR